MNLRSFAGVALVLAFSSVSCAAPSPSPSNEGETAQAITAGVPDDTDTSTVLIVAKVGGRTGFCSGVVVSPHVVVTAAHCSKPEASYSVFLGADYNDAAARALDENVVEVTEHHPHPKYDPSTNSHDIGVLITATALSPSPAILNTKPLIKSQIGQPIRIVGYGQTSGDSKATGRRTQGETTIADLDTQSLVIEGVPNICLTDSGGPTFMNRDGQDVLVGIHYLVDSAACTGQGVDVRVDVHADFVEGYISAADPPAEAGAADVDAGEPASPSPTIDSASASGCAMTRTRQVSSTWAGLGALVAVVLMVSRRRSR